MQVAEVLTIDSALISPFIRRSNMSNEESKGKEGN
jgi:hypothetical protein